MRPPRIVYCSDVLDLFLEGALPLCPSCVKISLCSGHCPGPFQEALCIGIVSQLMMLDPW